MARAISPSTSSLASSASTASRTGFVFGCFGVKTVQQSSYGRMEVSSVPMRRAMDTISSLSMPMSGWNIGMWTTAPVTAMASMVWLAT